MVRKRRKRVLAAAVLVGLLAACGGSSSDGGGTPDRVEISGFLFKPETLSVGAGIAVTWHNADDIAHTVTAGTPEAPTGAFDSGDRTKDQTFVHAFSTAGTFRYFCKNHNGMRGEVMVT